MEIINRYVLNKPFSNEGAGTCSWTTANRDGKKLFLKRYNTPKYMPACAEYCEEWEAKKRRLHEAVAEADDGNLIACKEFFRSETCYYLSTELVETGEFTIDHVSELPMEKKLILMRSLSHSMMMLEKKGIVHADLKISNLLLKPTIGGYFALKIIDFDSGFFEDSPPVDHEDLEGDITFLSPEALMRMCGEEVALTSKIDVFAAGIIFHIFLTGDLPIFDRDSFESVSEAVANSCDVKISPDVPAEYEHMIADMLSYDPDQRPTFEEIFEALTEEMHAKQAVEEVEAHKETENEALEIAPEPQISEAEPKEFQELATSSENPWMKIAGDL